MELLYRVLFFFAVIAGVGILFVIVRALVDKYLYRLASKTKTTVDEEIIKATRRPVFILFFIFVMLYLLPILSPPYLDFINKSLYGFLFLTSTIISVRVLTILIKAGLGKLEVPKEKALVIANSVRVVFYLIGALTILSALGITEAYSLAVSIGLIGFGITFALQYPLSCIVGWLFITLKRLLNVGYYVSVTGEITVEGEVIHVGYLFTKIREAFEGSYTGRIITIPNSAFMSGSTSIRNFASGLPYIRDEASFTIAYESDLREVRKLVMDAAKDVIEGRSGTGLLKDVEVFFEPAEGGWINVKTRYMINAKLKMRGKSDLTEKILEAFNKEPDRVKFPLGRSR